MHRLREVIAQVGFTRFESAVPDVNGELALDVERAALSLNQQWLPAVENRGEGVFIGFDRRATSMAGDAAGREGARRAAARRLQGVAEGPSRLPTRSSPGCRT